MDQPNFQPCPKHGTEYDKDCPYCVDCMWAEYEAFLAPKAVHFTADDLPSPPQSRRA
jgi:hypothetical protein